MADKLPEDVKNTDEKSVQERGRTQVTDILAGEGAVDAVYHAKARVLNDAMQEIGMGKYQWALFFVAGFGWIADNLWPVVTALIAAPVIQEFGNQAPYLFLSQAIGLLVGAAFWGVASDVWGRRWSFNLTLLIVGVFATAAGGSPSFLALCALDATWSVGVGGNLPVDSAVFLEFIPASHQYLLTVLSIWWAFGQLIASLVAWPFIANFSCSATASSCSRSENQGWRYFLFTMGGLMLLCWALRFFVFGLHESPKFLIGRGRDEEAVEAVRRVAKYNGAETFLSVEQLKECEKLVENEGQAKIDTSAAAAVKRKLQIFNLNRVKTLFATRKMAYSTSLLIILWTFVGLAFPLYNAYVPYYLARRGAALGNDSLYITYRNQVILSVIGVPGALLAGWMVDLPYLGRRGTLSISTALTGVFILCSTTARTETALLGWDCGYSFTSNVMYGVLYAVSPEIFPAPSRGTGNAIVAVANRIFGIMAQIIALYADLTTSVPVFVSGVLFLVASVVALLLPYEPRGKASI